MVLGTDLEGGNVDISLVLKVFLQRCDCFMFFIDFLYDLFLVDVKKNIKKS